VNHSWLKISTLIDDVKVKDDYTVQIHLKEAYQPALAELVLVLIKCGRLIFLMFAHFKRTCTIKCFDTIFRYDYTVQIHLKEAYQPALAELAMPRPYVFVSPKDLASTLFNLALSPQ
jgi:ABC-type transport system substrate-binding protein